MLSEIPENLPLSVCIITKNEGKNLLRLIQSINNIASEIIITDTGSEDDTKDICKALINQTLTTPAIRLYETEWNDDFSLARNESIKFATRKWILIMDADMEFPEESIPELKKCLQNEKITHYNVQCIEEKDNLIHPLCFLFRNNMNIKFTGYIHEYPVFDENIHFFGNSEIYIKHYGYNKKDSNNLRRERNIRLLKKTFSDTEISEEEKLRIETYLLIDRITNTDEKNVPDVIQEIYLLTDKIKKINITYHSATFEAFFNISLNFLSKYVKTPEKVLNTTIEYLNLFPFSVSLLYTFAKGLINARHDFFYSLQILNFICYLVKSDFNKSYKFTKEKRLWNPDFLYYCMAVICFDFGFYDAASFYLNKVTESKSLDIYEEKYFQIIDFVNQKKEILPLLKRDSQISNNSITHYRLAKELLRLNSDRSEITGQYNRALLHAKRENNISVAQIVISDLIINTNILGFNNDFIQKISEEAKVICNDYFYYAYALSIYNRYSGNEGKSFVLMMLAQKLLNEPKGLIEPSVPEQKQVFYNLLFEANTDFYFNKIISEKLKEYS